MDGGRAQKKEPATGATCVPVRRWARSLMFPLALSVMLLASACTSTSAAPSPTSSGLASVAELRVPTASAAPDLLVTAPDGTLWFTEVTTPPHKCGSF